MARFFNLFNERESTAAEKLYGRYFWFSWDRREKRETRLPGWKKNGLEEKGRGGVVSVSLLMLLLPGP